MTIVHSKGLGFNMRGLIVILFLSLLVEFGCVAQDLFPNLIGSKTVTSVAYYNVGDSKTYHVTQSQEKFKNDAKKPGEFKSSEYDLNLKVVGSTDTTYTFVLTYHNLKILKQSNKDKHKLDEACGRLSESLEIKYMTDEFGAFDSILNSLELAEVLDKAINAVQEEFEPKITDAKSKLEFSQRMAKFKAIISAPENISVLFIEDILNIHNLFGIEMTLGKPIEIDLIFPGLNGEQMNGTGIIQLKSIDKMKGEAKFSLVQKPNKDEVKEYIAFLAKLFFEEDGDVKNEASELKYSGSTKQEYQMSLQSGWMTKIKVSSNTKIVFKSKETRQVTKSEYVLK